MFLLGSSLHLDPDIFAVLPFSDSISVSPFSRSSDTSDFSVAFYTGFIRALRVHVPSASLTALLTSVSASSVVPESSATTVPFSPSSITSSNFSSTAPPVADSGPSSTSSSTESALSLLLSQLSAQVQSLSTQVASLQHPSIASSPPPPVLSPHTLSAPASDPSSPSIPWAHLVKVIPCFLLHPCLTVPSFSNLLVSPSTPFLFPLALVFATLAPHYRPRRQTFSF